MKDIYCNFQTLPKIWGNIGNEKQLKKDRNGWKEESNNSDLRITSERSKESLLENGGDDGVTTKKSKGRI